MNQENVMQRRVEEERLDRNTKAWKLASSEECPNFPVLQKEDLETLTLGVYQIRMSKRYTYLHLDDDSEFNIQLNTETPNVVRAKLESRFTQGKCHNCWISFDGDLEGVEAIKGYFCKCKQGARTVGCCSHVCTLMWYLGYYRHQPALKMGIRRRSLEIQDASSMLQSNSDVSDDSGSDSE